MQITEAKDKARRLFLGKEVVGVGILNQDNKELVFFLEHESDTLERQISDWARKENIVARFMISGRIQA